MVNQTQRVYELLSERYNFQERGPIQVKGKGEMITYLLKSKIQNNNTGG